MKDEERGFWVGPHRDSLSLSLCVKSAFGLMCVCV